MSDYEPGSMDIREHEKTFQAFVRIAAWNVVLIVVALIFLALVNG